MRRLISVHRCSSLVKQVANASRLLASQSSLCAGGKVPFKKGCPVYNAEKGQPLTFQRQYRSEGCQCPAPTRRTQHIRKDVYCYQIYFHPGDVGMEEPKRKQTFHRSKSKLKWMPSSVSYPHATALYESRTLSFVRGSQPASGPVALAPGLRRCSVT